MGSAARIGIWGLLAVVGLLLMAVAPPTIRGDAAFWVGLACFILAMIGVIVAVMRSPDH